MEIISKHRHFQKVEENTEFKAFEYNEQLKFSAHFHKTLNNIKCTTKLLSRFPKTDNNE